MKAQYLSGTGTPVKGFLKKRIQNTVYEYISHKTTEGQFLVCTDTEGKPYQLFLRQLHKNVMRNRKVFICSGDFADADGEDCTIDFTVARGEDALYVEEAEVHFLFTDDRHCSNGTNTLKVA